MWELRWHRDSFSIEAGRLKGRKDPEWVADCPLVGPGDGVYLQAFRDLESERPAQGATIGRIPWSKVRQYGREELGFSDDLLRPLWLIVSKIDDGYLEWMRDEYTRAQRNGAPGNSKSGKGKAAGATKTYNR